MWNKQATFTALVNALSGDLFRYAWWLCGDRSLAQDLVQETYTRAWRSIDKLRDTGSARQWLITTLRREHARLYERKQLEMSDWDVDDLPSSSSSSEQQTEIHLLHRALKRLAPTYREPLVLQVIYGYSCEEIAQCMDLTTGTVMTRLSRARLQLKNITRDCETPPHFKRGEQKDELPGLP